MHKSLYIIALLSIFSVDRNLMASTSSPAVWPSWMALKASVGDYLKEIRTPIWLSNLAARTTEKTASENISSPSWQTSFAAWINPAWQVPATLLALGSGYFAVKKFRQYYQATKPTLPQPAIATGSQVSSLTPPSVEKTAKIGSAETAQALLEPITTPDSTIQITVFNNKNPLLHRLIYRDQYQGSVFPLQKITIPFSEGKLADLYNIPSDIQNLAVTLRPDRFPGQHGHSTQVNLQKAMRLTDAENLTIEQLTESIKNINQSGTGEKASAQLATEEGTLRSLERKRDELPAHVQELYTLTRLLAICLAAYELSDTDAKWAAIKDSLNKKYTLMRLDSEGKIRQVYTDLSIPTTVITALKQANSDSPSPNYFNRAALNLYAQLPFAIKPNDLPDTLLVKDIPKDFKILPAGYEFDDKWHVVPVGSKA